MFYMNQILRGLILKLVLDGYTILHKAPGFSAFFVLSSVQLQLAIPDEWMGETCSRHWCTGLNRAQVHDLLSAAQQVTSG